jgi:hypothetical protein
MTIDASDGLQQQGADADATNTEAAAEEQNATKGSATEKETSGKASADTEPNAPEENRPVVFVFPPHAPAPEATLGTAEDSALSLPPHSAEVFLGGIPRSLTKVRIPPLTSLTSATRNTYCYHAFGVPARSGFRLKRRTRTLLNSDLRCALAGGVGGAGGAFR